MNNLNLSEKQIVDNLKIFQEQTNSFEIRNHQIKKEIDSLYKKFSYLSKIYLKSSAKKKIQKKNGN